MNKTRLLIVEDDPGVALSLQEALQDLGYDISAVAASGAEAIGHVERASPDLVLMDIGIEGDIDGIETAARLNQTRRVPVVYLTGRDDETTLERARETRPYGFVLKPMSGRGMHATIQMALARRKAEAELEASEQRFRESERRFASMLRSVHLLSVMLDPDARITYCNDYLLRLTGWKSAEVLGRDWFEVFVPPELTELRQVHARLLRDLPGAFHHESEIVTRSGERRLVQWSNGLLRSPTGEVVGTASLGQDITERKRAEDEVRQLNADLERRVAERTAELETANLELETYDRTVSHDLRAPARHIQGFGALLLEEYAHQLDARGREFVERMVSASERMNELITTLFELSTAGRGELRREALDLGAIAQQAFATLRKTHPDRDIELTVAANLRVSADKGMLQVVLENLLDNAFKFTSTRASGRIEVGAIALSEGTTAFFMRDNGAGFEMSAAGRLFAPFERLHSQAAFEGTGLGLATVQRIVARHGGRIWAEAEPDRGATFFFTLSPAKKKQREK